MPRSGSDAGSRSRRTSRELLELVAALRDEDAARLRRAHAVRLDLGGDEEAPALAAVESNTQQAQMQMVTANASVQAQSTRETVAELKEIQRLLQKMATRDDMYQAFKGAQQTSI